MPLQSASFILSPMRAATLFLLSLLVVMIANVYSQTPEKLAEIWDKEHISNIFPSDVRHADLKKYLEQLKKSGVRVDEVGRSNANREIYQMEFGRGPLRVFMWSQMHGDEPTATSAVIDMFAYLRKNHDKDWVKKISETVTIRAVPMLNPDGAELYQRRNLQGIDINRDAVDLKTPEAQLLKKLRDDWNPAIGFNLHNQGALTTVGRTRDQAAISLLVVYGDEAKTPSFGHERNLRLTSAITLALQKFIPGHIARYSDEWTPTAFGDNFSAWGTPTILIETGALYGRDEMFLVKMNFVALLTGLNALATGSEAKQDTAPYLSLADNSSGSLYHFIFRSAQLVGTSSQASTVISDIAVNTDRRRASFLAPNYVRNLGTLNEARGLEEYDATGFNVVGRFGTIKIGELAELLFYKNGRQVDWSLPFGELEKQFPPDSIFSGGKWIKGEKLVPRK